MECGEGGLGAGEEIAGAGGSQEPGEVERDRQRLIRLDLHLHGVKRHSVSAASHELLGVPAPRGQGLGEQHEVAEAVGKVHVVLELPPADVGVVDDDLRVARGRVGVRRSDEGQVKVR